MPDLGTIGLKNTGSIIAGNCPDTNENQSEVHADMGEEVKRGRGRPKLSANGDLIISRRVDREISKLSSETRITRQQIFEDICNNGLVGVRGMYIGLIETRKAIQQELDEKDTTRTSDPEWKIKTETLPDGSLNGEDGVVSVGEHGGGSGGDGDPDEQFDPAYEQRGFAETFEPALGEASLEDE